MHLLRLRLLHHGSGPLAEERRKVVAHDQLLKLLHELCRRLIDLAFRQEVVLQSFVERDRVARRRVTVSARVAFVAKEHVAVLLHGAQTACLPQHHLAGHLPQVLAVLAVRVKVLEERVADTI